MEKIQWIIVKFNKTKFLNNKKQDPDTDTQIRFWLLQWSTLDPIYTEWPDRMIAWLPCFGPLALASEIS